MDTRPLIELSALHEALWDELARAPRDRSHGWRIGTLATVAALPLPTEPGWFADARSVVLRDVDVHARELLFYTDSRSPKVDQIRQHPLGTLLLWSAPLGWQLRLRVELALHTSGLGVSSRWARLKMTPSAQDYLSPLPPGSELAAPATPQRATREHFAVVQARVRAMDWLELAASGHRRARFDEHGARWVVP